MMDKKSANGFQSKASDGGIQRKQLPYSVETPYGFHLDLDFLKYVDDIEKGNTIKRVHIQRRVKGPAKFSTLPRNFSLPGHGVRAPLKEKDSTWSGTSTLGTKPKSRVTEVQQIFDFRPGEVGIPTHSSRGTTSQGTGYISTKSRDVASTGPEVVEDKTAAIQSRPNLLRASSMPVTLQQRKGSDSSSPDCTVATPENGSTENIFRASPDVIERRCLPQDRVGLHQQITVALKRVRELEEQVKTIPELKAKICILTEEREKLLIQLQTQSQVSTSSSAVTTTDDTEVKGHSEEHGHSEGLKLTVATQPTGGSVPECVPVTPKESQGGTERTKDLPKEKEPSMPQQQTKLSDKVDTQKETPKSTLEHAVETLSKNTEEQKLVSLMVVRKETENSRSQANNSANEGLFEDQNGMQKLQEKLIILEAKLTQASQELEKTNTLLKEQIKENKAKEERILQLSEGMRVEICTTQVLERQRRESVDRGTVTEKIDFTIQNKETESPVTVDQGTDTDTICVEVIIPKPRAGSIDQGTLTSKVDTRDQETEIEAEVIAVIPHRPRVNSMERGMVTESIITQDQMTETPVAERVNQVTETEGETVTDHPHRPRASSVDRETETERVGTVDRVTETEVAQRTDQQIETERQLSNNATRDEIETERHLSNNTTRDAEADNQVSENESSQRQDVGPVVSDVTEATNTEEIIQKNVESFVEVSTDSSVTAVDDKDVETVDSAVENQVTVCSSPVSVIENDKIEVSTVQNDSTIKETLPSKCAQVVEPQNVAGESTEKKEQRKEESVCVSVKESVITGSVVVTEESSVVKTEAPVRPQRGRKLSAEQAQPHPQPQAAPVRPRRGSSETQAQQTLTKAQTENQPEAHSSVQCYESQEKHQTPSVPLAEDHSQVKKLPEESLEKQSLAQPKADIQSPSPSFSEVQVRPKSIQAYSKSQTASRRDSKELKIIQKGSSVSHSRESGETKTRPTRDAQPLSSRRSSNEAPSSQKDASETQSLRRGSSESTQRRGSSEAKASRRESVESQSARRGSSESPTSPAALGQVVTRLTGLLGEQWAQLGSSSGAQQTATQQESPSTQKQTTTKKIEAGKGTPAKPIGKTVPAATTTTKQAGKPGASKMSSIQNQLVSSLSVLSAFYSPAQKAAAASKQQEQGLKSIMKKNGVADKQGSRGTKKNLKFVGVNGGYETTSSEESSGDEKSKAEVKEDEKSEPDTVMEKDKESEETAEIQGAAEEEALSEGGGAVGQEKKVERGLLDLECGHELLEEQDEGEKVDKGFIDACIYVKDRMEEVSSPDKEMRQVLVVLYQEWFKVSSQKESDADTVRLYLRQVGLTTPTLLPYVVNLTDGNGNMALHYSVSHSNFPVVKLLLDTGLCETDNVNKAGYTPVMLAALTAAESPDDLEVAQQLLRLGNVNARSRQAGQTALMLAVSHGRVAMVKLLLSCGADVNAQDREGSTPLMCACEHGHTHIARLLLETGHCDTNLTDKNGHTALSVAEAAVHHDVVDLLKAHASKPTSAADPL